jgi:hypothetical protein
MVLLALTAAALRLLPLGWLHPLNWDEIEFFRATNWVAHGAVPFRDFWEHHTPLQWFVFAPVARFITGHDASAVMAMRWAQIPIWIAAFWLANQLMRRAGLDAFARWTAIAIALCSSLLMTPAVEFRIDVLGSALYLGGLVLALRMHEKRAFALGAGVLFCLAGLANLRLGPLLAVTVLLLRIVDPRERKWRGNVRANWIFAGVIAALGGAGIYFVATNSLRDLYQHVWVENYLGDRYADAIVGAFPHWLLVPFGIRIMGAKDFFDPGGIDVGGMSVLILGIIGLYVALRRWRSPDELFVLASLQVVSLAFIAAMKFIFIYHFEIVVLMFVPLIALVIERVPRRNAIVGLVAVAWIVNAYASILRGKELDLAYQNTIMNEVDARTRPGDLVWDGVGWALRREPAYRFWFLPDLTRQLVYNRHAERYRVEDFVRRPPAAVIGDHNALVWLGMQRDLQRVLVRHYIPLWRNLWIPAPNVVLQPGQTIDWVVPVDGDYRLFASAALAHHPWFRQSLFVGSYTEPDAQHFELHLGAPAAHPELGWDAVRRLHRGERIRMTSSASEPMGIILLPGSDDVLFRQPPIGVTLEAASARVTHVPRIW